MKRVKMRFRQRDRMSKSRVLLCNIFNFYNPIEGISYVGSDCTGQRDAEVNEYWRLSDDLAMKLNPLLENWPRYFGKNLFINFYCCDKIHDKIFRRKKSDLLWVLVPDHYTGEGVD